MDTSDLNYIKTMISQLKRKYKHKTQYSIDHNDLLLEEFYSIIFKDILKEIKEIEHSLFGQEQNISNKLQTTKKYDKKLTDYIFNQEIIRTIKLKSKLNT